MGKEESRYIIDRLLSVEINMLVKDKKQDEFICKKVKLRELYNPSLRAETKNMLEKIIEDENFVLDNMILAIDSAFVETEV